MKVLGIAAAAAVLLTGGAMAQSAKFSANYATDTVTLVDFELVGNDDSSSAGPVAEELLATIKAPKGKELLIGVSGVANIVTFTEVTGRNKQGKSEASAEGVLDLEVRYAPVEVNDVCANGKLAAPGGLTFASRKQTLSVDVNLDLIDLDGTDEVTADDLGIDGTVTVALGLDTTAAHHFNFVAIDLDQSGDYNVVACFEGRGDLSVSADDLDSNTASTLVAIAQRMVTVQEVRAVKGSIDPLPTN